jgi:hypothetical protein
MIFMPEQQNIKYNNLPQNPNQFIIFKTEDDKISVDVRFESETAWLAKPHKGVGKIGFSDVGKTKKNSRREYSSVETTKYPPLITFRRNVTNEISKKIYGKYIHTNTHSRSVFGTKQNLADRQKLARPFVQLHYRDNPQSRA